MNKLVGIFILLILIGTIFPTVGIVKTEPTTIQPRDFMENDCWLEVAFDKGFNIGGSIDAIIENVGSSDCFDINWTISSYSFFGSASCSSNGVVSILSSKSFTTVTCSPIKMGFIDIMSITINALACGITFADTSFAIILFGTLIIVIL